MTQRTHVSPDPALIARLHAACAPEAGQPETLDLASDRSAFSFGWRDLPLFGDAGVPAAKAATAADKRPAEA
jgi:hypothetical protein